MPVETIPLWLKLIWTAFVLVLIPVYTRQYPLSNFLWFSNVALMLTVVGLWLESRLILTMNAISLLIPETVWTIDFVGGLIFGTRFVGMTNYMFDPKIQLGIRGLSLYHLVLPAMLVWLVLRLGGPHPGALIGQTLVCWIVMLVVYFFTNPADNIDWVFGPGDNPQTRLPSWLYLLLVMILFPLCVYLPSFLLLRWLANHLGRA
jgi:hypothetical protein